jgi:hypothetical protein
MVNVALVRRQFAPLTAFHIRIKLLGGVEETISSSTNVDQSTADTSIPHPDERQITLDTDRSFVLYPVGERLESSLHQPNADQQT